MNEKYVVRRYETIVFIGSKRECRQFARNRNNEQNTDAHRVGFYEEPNNE